MRRALVIGTGGVAAAIAAACDDGGWTLATPPDDVFLVSDGNHDAVAVIGQLRQTAPGEGGAVILVIDSAASPLDRALLIAAIAAIASDHAPARRVSAVDIGPGADPEAVAAAALYLAGATSTTGQVLHLTADPGD